MFVLFRCGRGSRQLLTKKTFAVQTNIRKKKIVYLAIDELDKNHKGKMTLTILQVKDVCVNDPKVCFGQLSLVFTSDTSTD